MSGLADGDVRQGFRVTALYLDDRERPMGARFVHEFSGFELAFLEMDTAPQVFFWVNTAPDTDKGLPHAQEHLLLGKGNKGRHAAGVESMSLIESSAFTSNLYTAYHSRAIAGVEVFFDVLAVQFDAFLNPDYTDEEIRREFSHHGVVGEPGSQRLEEKGTVYVEMVSSYNKPGSRAWLAREATLHGADHPKAKSAGGIPRDIRTVDPKDIRDFHREHYRLSNMGAILVLPSELPLDETLRRMDGLLRDLQPEPSTREPDTQLPPSRPAPAGQVVVTDYPSSNANETVGLSLAWPPRLDLNTTDELLLDQFLSTLAGDVSTNLYARFIDAETRSIDVDARGVWAWVESKDGFAITIGLSGLAPTELTPGFLGDVRAQVLDELTRIASWDEGDPELQAFNERLLNLLIASERDSRDVLNQPPGFGNRGLRSNWYGRLQTLERTEGFRKSLTLAPEHAAVREIVEASGTPWTNRLRDWGLLEPAPYTFAQRPSPELQGQLETNRLARLEAETSRLTDASDSDDPQAALAAFHAEYEEATLELERLEQHDITAFVDSPPMTLDDFLEYREGTLPGSEIPVVESVFSSMTGASVNLALPLDGVSESDLVFLAQLPTLMSRVGVIENGVPLSAADVIQGMRREIQSATISLNSNPRTRRHELVVSARGVTPAETKRALEWAGLLLSHSDWRPENLSRIRDVVDQALDRLRNRTRAREEAWVRDPMGAFSWQSDPLFLATSSFLTARHDALRLRWMFRGAQGDGAVAFLERLADAGATSGREDLLALAGTLQGRGSPPASSAKLLTAFEAMDEATRGQVAEAAKDLEAELPSLPDSSLAADWRYLCRRMAADLSLPPGEALARLTQLRDSLLRTGGARAWTVGAEETLTSLAPPIAELTTHLKTEPASAAQRDSAPLLWSRLEQRGVDVSRAVFAALVEPSLTSGVVQHSAPLTLFEDTDEESVLDILGAVSYSGYGPHGLFMRTWGAGLAYSNGIRVSASRGRVNYYAERCPTLGETLTFVAGVLRDAEPDPSLGDYAVAQLFSSRAASPYDARATAMAADLAEGRTPETIRAFREAVLELGGRVDLHEELHARLKPTAGQVIPGLGVKLSTVEGGHYFAIGTETQLAAYESWLRGHEGPEATVHRLYPRDFWRIEPVRNSSAARR